MSQYYYLDDRREPQGPHSLDELSTMMAAGRVNPMTLVASIGGKNWEPLGTVMSRENAKPVITNPGAPPPVPTLVGCCPTCGVMLQPTEEGAMPQACPRCHREFLPKKPGIWANFCLAMCNYTKFSGRATRAEFWSFILVTHIIYFIFTCGLLIPLIPLVQQAYEVIKEIGVEALSAVSTDEAAELVKAQFKAKGLAEPGVPLIALAVVSCLGLIVSYLAFFIPTLSVTFRRLHDRGWSGWLLIGYFIIDTGSSILMELSDIESDFGVLTALALLTYLLSLAYLVYLIVVCATDSQRGLNTYGPSAKYPLG